MHKSPASEVCSPCCLRDIWAGAKSAQLYLIGWMLQCNGGVARDQIWMPSQF